MARAVLFLFCVLTGALGGQTDGSLQPSVKKQFAYEDAFGGRVGITPSTPRVPLLAPLPNVTGWADASHYLEHRVDPADRLRRLYAVSAEDGTARVHLDYPELHKHLPAGFTLDAATITTPDLAGFLFNRGGDLYHFDAKARRFRRLTENPADEKTPRFSPNGSWVAYTRNHDLYAYDLETGIEHRYTTDGSETVYSGWASWVYFEEVFAARNQGVAFWWSPDSTRLAFMRFDDSQVPTFPIVHTAPPHDRLELQRYPKAGDPNPLVSVAVVSVGDGRTVWMDFDPGADHYLAWPFWSADSKTLNVQWMNRGQDTVRIYACSPATGKKIQILEEKQSSWVRFFNDNDVYVLRNGSGLVLRSDVDGWDHLYYYSPDGILKKRLTSGSWRADPIVRVEEDRGWVYFTGKPAKSWDSHVMRVRLDGTGLQQLTTEAGIHRVTLGPGRPLVSPGGAYFVETVSSLTTPARMTLYRGDGTIVRRLGDARTAAMNEYAWGNAELFTIPSGDGFDLPAYWILPPDFDPSKQYPVLFSIYGGPDRGTVLNQWTGTVPHYWAQRGIISMVLDHRGSGHFGKKGVALMHRNLGKWEMADLIAAVKWLRTKPFVAKDRIGITGSSNGGYVTMMALTYGAEYFAYGLAEAGPSDWRLYDSIWVERFMDTPAENPDGYKNGSVLTWVDRYKGGLRIVHGAVDDNVHAQNAIQVADALIARNRSFEFMLYPASGHLLAGSAAAHATREAHDFWMRTLLASRQPDRSGPGR